MPSFCPQAITTLVDVITGGPGSTTTAKRFGVYRTGPELESFLGNCNIDLRIGSQSRLPAVREALTRANRLPDAITSLRPVFEAAVNPASYSNAQEHSVALKRLNSALRQDGYELVEGGGRHRLLRTGIDVVAASAVLSVADRLSMDSVQRDTDRALRSVDDDPEDAITASCAMVESACRTILTDLGRGLPAKLDISHLYAATADALHLSPTRPDLTPDLKRILGGLANVAAGIGSLRTHGGDAHGSDAGRARTDPRIARLTVHAASTITLFLVETWQRHRARTGQNG